MSNQDIDLGGYVTVDERLREFFAKYPEGRMRPVNPDRPFTIERIPDGSGQEHTYIVYAAAAYRTPDDPNPAIGVAYEQFPGRTPFTRTSELMNAETSAWGRALAALGIGIKGKIATRDEVYAATQRRAEPDGNGQRRQGPRGNTGQRPQRTPQQIAEEALKATEVSQIISLATEAGPDGRQVEVTDPSGENEPVKLGALLTHLKDRLVA
ncbi:hypothetical protein [Streptomyces mirabilis]|uniref:hypothetical protein n=1 Tax=Streptomyces mirabilis TaxID=68239 RepID=UPI0036DC2480